MGGVEERKWCGRAVEDGFNLSSPSSVGPPPTGMLCVLELLQPSMNLGGGLFMGIVQLVGCTPCKGQLVREFTVKGVHSLVVWVV